MSKKELRKLRSDRDALVGELETIVSTAAAEKRDFTTEEAEKRGNLNARITAVDDQIRAAEKAAKDARKAEKAAAARNAFGLGNIEPNSVGGAVKVKGAQRTYVRGGPFSFMNDLVQAARGVASAQARLSRHAQEIAVDAEEARQRIASGSPRQWDDYFVRQVRAGMGASGMPQFEAQYRDLSTAAGAGGEFVPPLYLTAEYVPYARPGRVFADACHKEPLPAGTMSINIPKVTSGTSVDTQGTQNTNVSDTDLQTAYVTFPVVTVAGAQILSLQLIERSPIAFDDVTFRDLHLAMAQKLDFKCIAGPGSGDITGALNTSSIVNVAWNTGGTGGMTGFYGVVANAKAQVASQRFLPATHAFFTPDRWEWLEQQLDSNGRPLIVPEANGPFNAAQVAPPAGVAEGVTGGRMLGLTALQDYNVPANLGAGTNQDAIIVAKMDDLYLYESPIVARALPQTYGQQLSVLLQVYEYAAFTAARYPVSVAYITGTELTNPISYHT